MLRGSRPADCAALTRDGASWAPQDQAYQGTPHSVCLRRRSLLQDTGGSVADFGDGSRNLRRGICLGSFVISLVLAAPARARDVSAMPDGQESATATTEPARDIIVTGRRGAADIPVKPFLTMSGTDLRSLGVPTVGDLLKELASATQRGGRDPVMLLNGRRISGVGEVESLPSDAIERFEVLPGQAALALGFAADRNVVNIIIVPDYDRMRAQADAGGSTAGGGGTWTATLGKTKISSTRRILANLTYAKKFEILEADRGIVLPANERDTRFRTLLPAGDDYKADATVADRVFGSMFASLNMSVGKQQSRRLIGLDAGANPASVSDADILNQRSTTDTFHLGIDLSRDFGTWNWSALATVDRSLTRSATERGFPASRRGVDTARASTMSASVQSSMRGSPLKLPAGPASVSFTVEQTLTTLDTVSAIDSVENALSLPRDVTSGRAALFLPLTSRQAGVLPALGDIQLNVTASAARVARFGGLWSFGGGINWSFVDHVQLFVEGDRSEEAPSPDLLSGPVLSTPNVLAFDFVRGEGAAITVISGGNPALRATTRSTLRIGAVWSGTGENGLSASSTFTSTIDDNPIDTLPIATAAVEQAFSSRFFRDAAGRLVAIDSRPLNLARHAESGIETSLYFVMPTGSRRGRDAGGSVGTHDNDADQRRSGARLIFDLKHVWRLRDRFTLAAQLPSLDLLAGDAIGSQGQSRHQLLARATWSDGGLGAQLSLNWKSGTRLNGGDASSDLGFSDLLTFDTRIFYQPGRTGWAKAQPWLRDVRATLRITNVFDRQIRVTDRLGGTPARYQRGYLDPAGRTLLLSLEKSF